MISKTILTFAMIGLILSSDIPIQNTCGDKSVKPTKSSTCTNVKLNAPNVCCYMSVEYQKTQVSLCMEIPGASQQEINKVKDSFKAYGVDVDIECSSKLYSLSVMVIALVAVLF